MYNPNSFNNNEKNTYDYNNYYRVDKSVYPYNSNNLIEDNNKENVEERKFFEILGLKLYLDDILLICIIFFLYKEEVHDEMLFIALILLLLS